MTSGALPEDEALAALILGRATHARDIGALADIVAGRRLLVTGAGGYIGSRLALLLAAMKPARIVLLDNGEHALYSIDLAIAEAHPGVERRALYCDVRDRVALDRCFACERPELVFHAAALKQLPLMESHLREAFLTNALGAYHVAQAARPHAPRAVILISSDKAAQPSSVMGATKRFAEMAFQSLDRAAGKTRFASVRFGNVFGSTGSVVPRFREQIARGGPVTLTDGRMIRYFMTGSEACSLVLGATALALDAREPRGARYLLEMGEPLAIADLARRMIAASGAAPGAIEIVEIGARPGERLTECLLADAETLAETRIPGVGRIEQSGDAPQALPISALSEACQRGDESLLRRLLAHCIAGFDAHEGGSLGDAGRSRRTASRPG